MFWGDFVMRTKVLAALVICAMSGGVACAADAVYELNPVVVTASRTEQDVFDTEANISVVTRKQLEESHYSDLGDVLKDVPGVNFQNYGASGENYTSNSLYINGSPNIVVLVDGMRANVNGSAGTVLSPSEFSNMNVIERVEVLKGSASTLYGADAVGGVINIITRKPEQGVHTTLGFAAGDYAHRTWDFMNSGREGSVYWMAAAHKNDMGNFKDGHGNEIIHEVHSKTYDVMLGSEINDKNDVTFRYNKYKSKYARPVDGGLNVTERADGKKDNERFSLRWDYKINSDLKNEMMVYRNNNYLQDRVNDPTNLWVMDLSTLGFTDQITWDTERNTLVAGFDYYQDRVNRYYSSSQWSVESYNGKKMTNRAFFLQDTFRFADHFSITPGIRHTSTSDFGSNTSKSMQLGYNNGRINVYTAYKQFFVAPNQYQLYSVYGSPNLKAAKGHTWEAGVNYDFGNNLLGTFNIYKTTASDMIAFDSSTFKYANIDSEKTYGWSVGLNKRFNKHWTTSASYVHTRIPAAAANKNPNRDGYIPKGEVKFDIGYENAKFDAGFTGRGILNRPGRKALEAKVPSNLKTFWILDFDMNFKPTDNMDIFFRINNLTDKFYTERMYNADPAGNGWYSAPGRNMQIGVEYHF